MSGELGFLLVLPAVIPMAIGSATVKAVGEAGTAAVQAAARYEKKRKEERELIRQSGIKDEMKGFRHSLRELMEDQQQKNQALSVDFESALAQNRKDLQTRIGNLGNDTDRFREEAQESAAGMINEMDRQQKILQNVYQKAIVEELEKTQQEEQERLNHVLEDLTALEDSKEKKQQALQTEARKRLDESRELLQALTDAFQGGQYLGADQIRIHSEAYAEAEKLFSEENYEGSLIAVSSLSASLRSDILLSDKKRMEYENWQKTALLLVEENLGILDANSVLTQETYDLLVQKYEEQGQELSLDQAWVGQELYPFWGRTQDGEFYYTAVKEQLGRLKERVLSEDCPLSADELKEIARSMSSEMRPQLITQLTTMYERLMNAWQREQLSDQITDCMEDMDFTYENCSYLRRTREGETVAEEEDRDARLCMAFRDQHGDEILVDLSNHHNGIRLEVTDMIEEYNPEIDRSAYRNGIEESIREVVFEAEESGIAENVTGGCTRPGQQIVTNPENRRRLQLVMQDDTE